MLTFLKFPKQIDGEFICVNRRNIWMWTFPILDLQFFFENYYMSIITFPHRDNCGVLYFRFAITDTAYRSLDQENTDQCILISGIFYIPTVQSFE